MSNVEQRLEKAGFIVPKAAAAAAAYKPFMISDNLIYVSGQLPMVNGEIAYKGKVGSEVTEEEGKKAAQACAINIIAQIKAAILDLDKVKQIVKIGGFVNCAPDFYNHPQVINGASELISLAFEEKGEHARFAVGAPSLPFDVSVEVDAIVAFA